jgi:hypothetical protein
MFLDRNKCRFGAEKSVSRYNGRDLMFERTAELQAKAKLK